MAESSSAPSTPKNDEDVVIVTPKNDDDVVVVKEWGEDINPSLMIEIMQRLTLAPEITGKNKKPFYATYKNDWKSLKDDQKNKALTWYQNCTDAGKLLHILLHNIIYINYY